MPTDLPLSEATADEIIVRTTYQIIRLDYRDNPEQYNFPATRLFDLALTWRIDGLHLIADCLMSCATHVADGHTIASWKSLHLAIDTQRMLALSRLGHSRKR